MFRRRHQTHHSENKSDQHSSEKEMPHSEHPSTEHHHQNTDKPEQTASAETTSQSQPTFVTEVVGSDATMPVQEFSSEPSLASHEHSDPTDNPPASTDELANTPGISPIPDRSDELKDALMYADGNKSSRSLATPFLFAVAILLAGVAGYFYLQKNQLGEELAKQKRSMTGTSSTKSDQDIIDAVTKLTSLPAGEQPLVATIIDSTKLKDTSTFFKDSRDNDRLLITGKKAILYRPQDNRIVATGSVSFLLPSPAATGSASPSEGTLDKPRLALRNGTTINGLTKKYEPKLKKAFPDSTIVRRENAKKQTYERTIIVDLTGKHADQAKTIGRQLGIEVSELPEDEAKPADADFLLILGVDAE